MDPNELRGPRGFGARNFVPVHKALAYRVKFENFGPGSVSSSGAPIAPSAWATAPAQEVEIVNQLAPTLDWSTFRFVNLGFGSTIVSADQPTPSFQKIIPVTIGGRSFAVHFDIAVNPKTGRIRAMFRCIDPSTALPPDALTGFLPPEDGLGVGQGFIEYTVEPRPDLLTGTEIRNVALISFDRQPTIATDQVDPTNPSFGTDPGKQALVTIDSGAPVSSVAALPPESGCAFFVEWSGADDASGSGIASYTLLVSTNGGPFSPLFQSTQAGAFPFQGEIGNTYAFYSVGRDNVGNEQATPVAPQAITTVSANSPVLQVVTNLNLNVGEPFSLSNGLLRFVPGHDHTFALDPWSVALGAKINSTNGTLSWTPKCHQARSTNSLTVWVTDNTWTNLSDAMTITAVIKECLEPTLGTLILPVGQTGRLPVNLVTSEQLTNLTMSLDLPQGKLVAVNVEVREEVTNAICTAWLELAATPLPIIGLASCTNTWMTGTQQVAWLYLTAPTNQPSSFQWVHISDFIGTRLDGTQVTNVNTQSGRVVVLADEPLLEALRGTNGLPALMFYGIEGTNYMLRSTTDLGDTPPWQTNWQGAVTNTLFRRFEPIGVTNRSLFFRAWRE